jgi:5-formaminoimidazole-4-carboxamide-1-beta-D-ribofuranosyl 5'-monophosphate synthetase
MSAWILLTVSAWSATKAFVLDSRLSRLDSVQASAKQVTETVQELSRNAASTAELVMLKASVETIETRVRETLKKSPCVLIPRRSRICVENVRRPVARVS